ncbi:hypothetical protein A9Q68_03245 [Streptococcus bovimastitidis]|uniref:Uncharacterized protein n=1 Tax=Streptococcus bovimastitidis TaxID=1856638 RepID=A0A1L8MPA5_9STRE|nr:hypothetical protein [Streptococcus bovimastitidis]OJF72577.1 hypothetical protein A9Q68_03245 [Streptococcus bovimastitidis]
MSKNYIESTNQKKSGKGLKIFGLLLLLIMLAGAGAAYYKYQEGNIDGTWQAKSLQSEIDKNFNADMKKLDSEMGIKTADAISKPEIKMVVKDGKVQMTYYLNVNSQYLSQEIYNYYKTEMNKILNDSEVNLEEVAPDVKDELESSITSQADLKNEFDAEFTNTANEIGGTYNKDTGMIETEVASGKVNPFFNRIEITSINQKAGFFKKDKSEKYIDYVKSAKDLILKGEKDKVTFTK